MNYPTAAWKDKLEANSCDVPIRPKTIVVLPVRPARDTQLICSETTQAQRSFVDHTISSI